MKKALIAIFIVLSLAVVSLMALNKYAQASDFCLAHNIHNEKKLYVVVPCWIIEKSKALEPEQWPNP